MKPLLRLCSSLQSFNSAPPGLDQIADFAESHRPLRSRSTELTAIKMRNSTDKTCPQQVLISLRRRHTRVHNEASQAIGLQACSFRPELFGFQALRCRSKPSDALVANQQEMPVMHRIPEICASAGRATASLSAGLSSNPTHQHALPISYQESGIVIGCNERHDQGHCSKVM